MFHYSSILEHWWQYRYTRNVPLFINTGTLMAIPVHQKCSIIHQYWNIDGNTGTPEMFHYSSILEHWWQYRYTRNVPLFINTGTLMAIPVHQKCSIIHQYWNIDGNTGTPEMFHYSSILEHWWQYRYTRNVPLFINTGTLMAIPVHQKCSIIHQYWNIDGNTGTPEMFHYSSILEHWWQYRYTRNVPLFINTGTLMAIPVHQKCSIIHQYWNIDGNNGTPEMFHYSSILEHWWQYRYTRNVPLFINTGTFQYLGHKVYFSCIFLKQLSTHNLPSTI